MLIVDVEQTEEDAVILRNDMVGRGLDGSGVFWLDANGRALDVPDDKKWLTRWVRALRPQLIILDTGTETVTKAREDESVKPLFIALHGYQKNEDVRAVILLAQPRKRSQDAPSSRRFDDLFGSRVWKGRSSAVLYLERERLSVWKQRGGYLKRRWGGTVGWIERSDTEPTLILGPKSAAEAGDERRAAILSAVAAEPGSHSKTSLIEDELKVNGHDRPEWRKTVDALIREGRIRSDGRYSKLYLAQSASTPAPVVGADFRPGQTVESRPRPAKEVHRRASSRRVGRSPPSGVRGGLGADYGSTREASLWVHRARPPATRPRLELRRTPSSANRRGAASGGFPPPKCRA